MNGHFDAENPEKVVHKGEYSDLFDDLRSKALAQNTHKFVFNFWDEDLRKEYDRVKSLNITQNLSKIKYVYNVSPYYFFHLTDPDETLLRLMEIIHLKMVNLKLKEAPWNADLD